MPILALPPEKPEPDYALVADVLRELPDHLEARQLQLRLSNAVTARQIGVSTTTLSTIYRGGTPSLTSAIRCLDWLAR